jgi:hypothetical protein
MRKRLSHVAAGILLLITAAPAVAEPPAPSVSPPDFINVGDSIRLWELGNGVRISSRVGLATPTEIGADRYRLQPTSRLKTKRRGDPIWEGAAIGFAVGSLLLFPVIPETFVPRGGMFRINNGLFWGAIGSLIDHIHR